MDITAGMSHESIGDAIKDGLGESHSEFWKQGPSAFVEGFVELIQALRPANIHVPAAMLFRRIVQMARERTASHRLGNLDPIILICDEYANYAAAGHVQAWNTIRESNFVATVGITSISALVKQLGDQHAANAIVANFANKFLFEVDDKATRDLATELVGKTTVLRRGSSEGTSKTRGTSASAATAGGSHQSTGTTRSDSMSEHREEALDGAIWRSLRAERDSATAIAFIRADEGTTTDVVTLGVLDPANRLFTAVPEHYGL
jgi:hypothetical protein